MVRATRVKTVPSKKTFGGKTFRYYASYSSKARAQRIARTHRSIPGRLARVLEYKFKSGKSYVIYIRH